MPDNSPEADDQLTEMQAPRLDPERLTIDYGVLPASAAATTATATTAVAFLRPGFINAQWPTIKILAVQAIDGSTGLAVRTHFDEAEALALTGIAIRNDRD
jgi:hypothetical protein